MREPLAELEGGGAVVVADVLEHVGVVGGIDDDGDGAVVFGGAAEHRGAADVDVLDGFLEGDVSGLATVCLEGVEIDHHEVDGLDAVCLRLGDVLRIVAQIEEPAVDLRMEGLDAAIENFGEAGEVGDLGDGDPLLFQERRRCRRWR